MPSLERAKLLTFQREAPPADGEAGPRKWKFRANDGGYDRYNDRLNVKGWQLDAYNANPVILVNHDDWMLSIGKGKAFVDGDALMVEIEFDQDDELARRVEKKVEGGFMNAVSVRYLMHDYRDNERGGYDSDAHELLEISIVTIPGNQRAVRAKSLKGVDVDALAAALAKALKSADEDEDEKELDEDGEEKSADDEPKTDASETDEKSEYDGEEKSADDEPAESDEKSEDDGEEKSADEDELEDDGEEKSADDEESDEDEKASAKQFDINTFAALAADEILKNLPEATR